MLAGPRYAPPPRSGDLNRRHSVCQVGPRGSCYGSWADRCALLRWSSVPTSSRGEARPLNGVDRRLPASHVVSAAPNANSTIGSCFRSRQREQRKIVSPTPPHEAYRSLSGGPPPVERGGRRGDSHFAAPAGTFALPIGRSAGRRRIDEARNYSSHASTYSTAATCRRRWWRCSTSSSGLGISSAQAAQAHPHPAAEQRSHRAPLESFCCTPARDRSRATTKHAHPLVRVVAQSDVSYVRAQPATRAGAAELRRCRTSHVRRVAVALAARERAPVVPAVIGLDQPDDLAQDTAPLPGAARRRSRLGTSSRR